MYPLVILGLLLGVIQTTDQASTRNCLYGLIVDTSMSVASRSDVIRSVMRQMINGKRSEDRIFILTFAGELELLAEATEDKETLLRTTDWLHFGGGPTKLLDALSVSAKVVNDSGKDHRCQALVLITDGGDKRSETKADAVLKTLQEGHLPVFVLAFPDVIPKEEGKKARKRAVELVSRIAKLTGGKAWFPKSETEVTKATDQMRSELSVSK